MLQKWEYTCISHQMQDLVYITTVKIQCTCIIAMSIVVVVGDRNDPYNQCNERDNSTDHGKDSEDY